MARVPGTPSPRSRNPWIRFGGALTSVLGIAVFSVTGPSPDRPSDPYPVAALTRTGEDLTATTGPQPDTAPKSPTIDPGTPGSTPQVAPTGGTPPEAYPTPQQSVAQLPEQSPAPSATPQQDGHPSGSDRTRAAVTVTAGDVVLGSGYWNATSTLGELTATVTNTGAATESIQLSYLLPSGLTDAGTPGCSPAGGLGFRCAARTVTAGSRFTVRIRVRVNGDAWRAMPLGGSVRATAVLAAEPDGPVADGSQSFAVLFPAGPPVAGLTLSAGDVNFDVTGQPTSLLVRLGNTGTADATGTIEVVLPSGVSVSGTPSGCRSVGDHRTRCDVGLIQPGRASRLRLPVAATARAQRSAPLSGAVVGVLKPSSGSVKRMQMSFRITAVAGAGDEDRVPGPVGSQGVLPPAALLRPDGALTDLQKTAIALIVVSTLLALFAIGVAVTRLRRRSRSRIVARR